MPVGDIVFYLCIAGWICYFAWGIIKRIFKQIDRRDPR